MNKCMVNEWRFHSVIAIMLCLPLSFSSIGLYNFKDHIHILFSLILTMTCKKIQQVLLFLVYQKEKWTLGILNDLPLHLVRILSTIPFSFSQDSTTAAWWGGRAGGLKNTSPGSFCSPIYSWICTSSLWNKWTWRTSASYLSVAGKRSELEFQVVDCRLGTTLWITISQEIYRMLSTSHT